MWICRIAESASRLISVDLVLVAGVACCDMSLLDEFARMRLYRNRASEFELLAEAEPVPEARLRYRIIAQHYRELADRDEHSDKARVAQTLELLRRKRREAAE
jgi:hypothetical protein